MLRKPPVEASQDCVTLRQWDGGPVERGPEWTPAMLFPHDASACFADACQPLSRRPQDLPLILEHAGYIICDD